MEDMQEERKLRANEKKKGVVRRRERELSADWNCNFASIILDLFMFALWKSGGNGKWLLEIASGWCPVSTGGNMKDIKFS